MVLDDEGNFFFMETCTILKLSLILKHVAAIAIDNNHILKAKFTVWIWKQ